MLDRPDDGRAVEDFKQSLMRAEERIAALRRENDAIARQKQQLERSLRKEQARYTKLASSKLGRLTLAYWKVKDRIKGKVRNLSSWKSRFLKSRAVRKLGVTVIIPTYKYNQYVEQAVDSALKQKYKGKIVVLLCVNGGDKAYYNRLKKMYRRVSGVKVLFTERKGANAGRNIGLLNVETSLFMFLDDDDYISNGYVNELALGFLDKRVNLSTGRMEDLDVDTGRLQDTYYNAAMKKAKAQMTEDYYAVGSIFGTICMKMYRTDYFKDKIRQLDENYSHSEDVMFWAKGFGMLQGPIYIADPDGGEAYVRRKTPNSLSRPDKSSFYRFYITDRLRIICAMSNMLLDETLSDMHKRFLISKVKTQTAIMQKFFITLSGKQLAKAQKEIFACKCLFLNKSLFSSRRALAFCHNFSPWIDASAFVATKRLGQISQMEGGPLQWHVVKQNMGKIRSPDMNFHIYYTDFAVAEQVNLDCSFGFAPASQKAFADAAYKAFEGLEADIVYSRALFVGSHMAAYRYKKDHPSAKWYAEFSDPHAYGVDDKPRPCVGTPTWFDIEQLVYECADVIIFTNANQMEYMLSYNPKPELNDSIRRRSLVLSHPVIPREYCFARRYEYDMDKGRINVGFFGTFYANRTHEDLMKLLDNKQVTLHVFTTKPEELQGMVSKYGSQLRVNKTIGHLEFLNLGRRMDYLFLGDTAFPGKLNPFLPSKYADYKVTGTRIIAKIQHGSPLSKMEDRNLIKVESMDASFVNSLSKSAERI